METLLRSVIIAIETFFCFSDSFILQVLGKMAIAINVATIAIILFPITGIWAFLTFTVLYAATYYLVNMLNKYVNMALNAGTFGAGWYFLGTAFFALSAKAFLWVFGLTISLGLLAVCVLLLIGKVSWPVVKAYLGFDDSDMGKAEVV